MVADCAIFSMRKGAPTDEQCEANARLIAAAPDLLFSLAWLLDIEGRTDRETVTEERPLALAAARKAIAAIKGGAQ